MTFTSLPHWFDTLGEVSAWLACVAYAGESVFSGIGGDIDAMDLPVSFRLPWVSTKECVSCSQYCSPS